MNSLPTILITLALAAFSSAQASIGGAMPATIIFAPYKLANCTMSTNYSSTDTPSAFVVTSGHCYNSTYGFHSYYGATNWVGNIPCAMTIYDQLGCTGTTGSVHLGNSANCSMETMTIEGQSFILACGP